MKTLKIDYRMKQYHLGTLLSALEFRNSEYSENNIVLQQPDIHYLGISSTILRFFLGYNNEKRVFSAFLKTEPYASDNAKAILPQKKNYYEPLSYVQASLAEKLSSPCLCDAYFFIVENGYVTEAYRISDLLDKGELQFGEYRVLIDKDSFIKGETGDYPYLRVNVFKNESPIEFGVIERMIINRFFERQVIIFEEKKRENSDFDSQFLPLLQIYEHVNSVNISSILSDLKIKVWFSTWRKDPEMVDEYRYVSCPKEKLDPFLEEFIGLRRSIGEQAFDKSYNFGGKETEPFDKYFRSGYDCSYNHFNRSYQSLIRRNNGLYSEECVNYVREALINQYSPQKHRDYLMRISEQHKRLESFNFLREYYYHQSLVGSEKAYFLDMLISISFAEILKKHIGCKNFTIRYGSINEIINKANRCLANISWLLLHTECDWPSF